MQRFWYTRMITKMDQGLLDELFKGLSQKEDAIKKADETEDQEAELAKIRSLKVCVSKCLCFP